MNKIVILLLTSICFLLTACSSIHPVTLVNVQGGEILKGQYDEGNQSVQVTMPSGEILSGHYSLNRQSSMTFGTASSSNTTYSRKDTFNSFGNTSLVTNTISDDGQAYAILTGNKGTVMEILVNFSGSSGFGKAKTNKGQMYGVQF